MSHEVNKQTRKRESEQNKVSAREKCRFGLNVHNFIVLKHG